jgi:hypothetical protein
VQATPEDAAVRKQVEPPVAKKAPPKAAPKTAVIKKKPAPEQPIEIN